MKYILVILLLAAAITASAGDTKSAGKWRVSTENDPVDHSKKTYLALDAEGKDADAPVLFVRKAGDRIDIYIAFTSTHAGSDGADVTLRWDSKKPVTEKWGTGADEKSVFCHSLGDFFNNLMKSRKLTVSLSPPGKKPVTCVFDIDGFTEAVKSLGIIELPASGANTPPPSPTPEIITFPTPNTGGTSTGFGDQK